ncbi:hypothetical protein K445DRAFT_52566 [Daldinia sp. EC12]|nr:hypothetical protein K445DRAFT_52566 [Daldinia sp. EC12]
MASCVPTPYGQRLISVVADELAHKTPYRIYAAISKTSDISDGFRDITMKDLARCVNFTARWIENQFGRSNRFDTLTYIGISDLRGPIVFLAAVKCGYKLLLLSPRNTPLVNVSLMDQTESTVLLHTSDVTPIVRQIQDRAASQVVTQVVPSFDEMMNSNPDHYPYTASFDSNKNDPVVVLHSSGSTGLPKPVTMTHGTFAALDNQRNLQIPPDRERRDNMMWEFDGEARVYTIFPFFHVINPIFRNCSPIMGPPYLIPDGPFLKSIIAQQRLRAMFLVPSVVEALLQDPDDINLFKQLDFIALSGAPSNPAIGNRLSEVVELVSPFGSTETVMLPELALPREDWEWHEFNPYLKHELRVYDSEQGIFELVLLADESMRDHMPVYHNLPGVSDYCTKDLFLQNPRKPKLFKYYGRSDDIIVLANGEKFNPVPFEINAQSHPDLKGALMVGNGRTHSGLIIEPKQSLGEADRQKLIRDLWPLIETSNSLIPGQGRIQQGMVVCALSDKPFARTAKGTVTRKLTERLYEAEVESLYSKPAAPVALPSISLKPILKQVYERSTVVDFLRSVLAKSFVHASSIGEDEDFYSYGLDSLQTLEIAVNLKHGLQSQLTEPITWISARTIYRNPTLADQSRMLTKFLNDGIVPEEDHKLASTQLLDDTVAYYTAGLPKRAKSPAYRAVRLSKVALIGSTGYLGPYLVSQLLKNSDISHIYCLNRGDDAKERQLASLRKIDESLEQFYHKLVFMTVELGKPRLGLKREQYDLLAHEVDAIVLNSWRLDFGLSIKSFAPFLRATRDLVELSAESSHNMHAIFISSSSSVGNMASKTIAPEAPVDDASAATDIGYAQSKLAAERILNTANEQCNIPVTVVRVCQVGGPTDSGIWVEQPWILALLRTVKTLRCAPVNFTTVDCVPVDTAASMLSAFIVHPAQDKAQFFNIYPPEPQSWQLVVNYLNKRFNITSTAPWQEWIGRLRSITNPTTEDVTNMPALKILDFFETFSDSGGPLQFATTNAIGVSGVDIPTVDEQMVERWLDTWDI